MNSEPILTLDWPAVAGGGFIVSVLFLALVERLRRTFASKQEMDGLAEKLTTLEGLCRRARESAEEARERVLAAQSEQRYLAERLADQVVQPLGRVSAKVESLGEVQAAQAVALDLLGRRLEHVEAARAAARSAARRKPR